MRISDWSSDVCSSDLLIDSTALLGQSTLAHTGRPALAYQEHMTLFEAIAARDADGAEKEARSHIRQALLARLKQHRQAPTRTIKTNIDLYPGAINRRPNIYEPHTALHSTGQIKAAT